MTLLQPQKKAYRIKL